MSTRIAFVSAALLVVSGAALSQPQPQQKPTLPFDPPAPAPAPKPPSALNWPPAPAPASEKSVDDLLNELERVQAQKAALEKGEAELKAAIRKSLDAQTERLKKLGVAKDADRVGQIIIEGNTKTPQKKILDLVELQPGQLLPYPVLEAARVRLEKAGFRDVTVEVVPNKLDSTFKDVRVKVSEPIQPVGGPMAPGR